MTTFEVDNKEYDILVPDGCTAPAQNCKLKYQWHEGIRIEEIHGEERTLSTTTYSYFIDLQTFFNAFF